MGLGLGNRVSGRGMIRVRVTVCNPSHVAKDYNNVKCLTHYYIF